MGGWPSSELPDSRSCVRCDAVICSHRWRECEPRYTIKTIEVRSSRTTSAARNTRNEGDDGRRIQLTQLIILPSTHVSYTAALLAFSVTASIPLRLSKGRRSAPPRGPQR